jgi:uncharacterized protein (TIGR00251 family)
VLPISSTATGVLLRLRVQPRASREELAGVAGDAIRIRLTAPPVDGTANEALVRFLAVLLQVPRSAVELVSGRTGRTKLVAVTGVSVEETVRRLGVEQEP